MGAGGRRLDFLLGGVENRWKGGFLAGGMSTAVLVRVVDRVQEGYYSLNGRGRGRKKGARVWECSSRDKREKRGDE